MNFQVDIEINSSGSQIPLVSQLESWINTALVHQQLQEAEVSIYIVDETEGQEINQQYRNKNYPTNVLSFPADIPEEVGVPLLGDLIICAPVVNREAQEQGKSIDAHWAHMVIHGCLHLLGYDHQEDKEADEMEAIEIQILDQLGFPHPYNSLADTQ